MRLPFVFFMLFSVVVAQGASARTVIYTTQKYPVTTPLTDMVVLIPEDIQQLAQSLFPALSDTPAKAEQQAKQRMQQPDWGEQEARLTRAYQTLLNVQSAGIEKVPSVVFDDRFVVYGTTDIRLAQQKFDAWREQQP
jgi:integrating conjugative element protein (TIGR03757 family)